MMTKGMYSSVTDEWATPQEFYDGLDAEFRFDLDPCATKDNAKCREFFTREQDGPAAPRKPARERLEELCGAVRRMTGTDPMERCRDLEHVAWRQCVFRRMVMDGYTYMDIDRASGYDHATIHHAVMRFARLSDVGDPMVAETWEEFEGIL